MGNSLKVSYFELNKQKVRDLIKVLLPEEVRASSSSLEVMETTNRLAHKMADEEPALFKQLVSIADFKLTQPELWVEMIAGENLNG